MSIDAIGSAFRFSKTYRGQTEEVGLRFKGRTKNQAGRTKNQRGSTKAKKVGLRTNGVGLKSYDQGGRTKEQRRYD